MKVIGAIVGTPPMSKEEIDAFLQKNLILQIGTIDKKGDPNILPIWFNYDRSREKLLILTLKTSKKIHNIRKKATNRERDIGAGRHFKLVVKGRLIMVLVYYSLYIIYTLTKFLFGLDQSNVCRDIEKIESLIRLCLPIHQKLYNVTKR